MGREKETYEALREQGQAALGKQNFDKALKVFKKALILEPENPEATKNVGNAYFELKKYNQAKRFYRKSLSFDFNYWEAHNNLSILYGEIEENDLAILEGEKALQLKSDSPIIHNNLGNLYSKLKNYKKSEYHYRKALTLGNNSSDIMFNFAMLLYRTDKYSEALNLFEHLKNHPPENNKTSVLYYLGILYSSQRNPLKSIEIFEELLSIDRAKDKLAIEHIRWVYKKLSELYLLNKKINLAVKYQALLTDSYR